MLGNSLQKFLKLLKAHSLIYRNGYYSNHHSVKSLLAVTKEYAQIGSYWEKRNKNEIDIVAVNEMDKQVLIAEVKLQEKNSSIPKLQSKAYALLRKSGGFEIQYKGFSLKDM